MAAQGNIQKNEIRALSIAGNTTMVHLFMGLNPYHICREPYIPLVNEPDPCHASELGISIFSMAPVWVLPNIGSYFGGDLIALGPGDSTGLADDGWTVGIESLSGGSAVRRISLATGALATSGDSRRYLIREGRRYGHILDPRTGWPVPDAPRSVTVLAATCTQAGMLATFAMLMGCDAESFLRSQDVKFWCLR
ncbi:MAG: FAD:protein FMN transferase [Gammaproteobacteria bacterium]